MKIVFSKEYQKAHLKLSPKKQDKVEETISLFQKNPHDPQLKNHALHGKLKDYRAISADSDLRLIFRVHGEYEKVVFIMLETHTQVY